MNSQRKPTTYGKVSRRPLPEYLFAGSDDDSPNHSSETYQAKARREIQRTDQTLPKKLLNSEDDAAIPRVINSCQPPIAAFRSRRIVGPHGKLSNQSHRKPSVSPRDEVKLAISEEDRLFDVPSSDDEDSVRLNTPGSLLKRKRRTFVPGAVKDESGHVCDDATLQRHVAAEASKDLVLSQESHENVISKRPKSNSSLQAISQEFVTEQHPSFQATDTQRIDHATTILQGVEKVPNDPMISRIKATVIQKPVHLNKQKLVSPNGGLHASIREGRSRGVNVDNCNQATMRHDTSEPALSSVNLKTGGRLRPKVVQEPSPKPGGTSSERESSSIAASTISELPVTPPRISTLRRTTTPRQAELWNMLLKDDKEKLTTTPFNSPEIGDKLYNMADVQPAGSQPEIRALSKSASELSHRRRRLVDNLRKIDDDLSYVNNSSEAEFGSTLSLKSDNSDMELSQKDSTVRSGSSTVSRLESVTISPHINNIKANSYVLPSHNQPPLHQCGGLKVTYARERSFLTDDDLSQSAFFDLPLANDLVPETRRQRLRKARAVMPRLQTPEIGGEDLDDVEDAQKRTMRSIYELREAGGNARVFSEMEAMLDDIDEACAVSPTIRRSKLLDLAVKLQGLSFCRLFIDQKLDKRLFAQTVATDDLILDALLATILLRLLENSPSMSKVSQISDSGVKDFLIQLLNENEDLALSTRSRIFNCSKKVQGDLKNVWDSLLRSTAWRAGKPTILTPRVISLQCLEYLVRQTRETGYVRPILSRGDIRIIVRILQPDSSVLPQQQSSPSLALETHLSISILESYTISNAVLCEDTPWTGQTLRTIVGLLSQLDSWLKEDVGTLRTLTLRLYLNLTNNNPELCKAFSKPDVIGPILGIIVSHFQSLAENDMQDKPQVLLDNLILSLGSMINLAEWSDSVRPLVLTIQFMDRCFLDILLQLFTSKQKTAAEVRPFLLIHCVDLNLSGFLREGGQLQRSFRLLISPPQLLVCQ